MRPRRRTSFLISFSVGVLYILLLKFLQASLKSSVSNTSSEDPPIPRFVDVNVTKIVGSGTGTFKHHISTKETISIETLQNQINRICNTATSYIDLCLSDPDDDLSWNGRPKDRQQSTSIHASVVRLVVRPFGFPSSVAIATKDQRNLWKSKGGDFWDVKVYGDKNTVLHVDVRDLGDGTYTGYFVIPKTLDDGDNKKSLRFRLNYTLEYSECNGLRDMPKDWFRQGTIQGKFQRDGIIGDCDDFLHQTGQSVSFEIPSRGSNRILSLVRNHFHYDTPYKGQPFNLKCGGFWHAGKFHGYDDKQNTETQLSEPSNLLLRHRIEGSLNVNEHSMLNIQRDDKHYSSLMETRNFKFSKASSQILKTHGQDIRKSSVDHLPTNSNNNDIVVDPPAEEMSSLYASSESQLQTLKIYGDSMGRRLYESLVANHTLCRNLFKQCSLSYTWVYKMFNETVDRYQGVHNYDNQEFNESRFLSDLKTDLTTPDMLCGRSVYVVNFGVHTIMTLPLSTMRELLRKFIDMVTGLRLKYGTMKSPLVIWKTTTDPYLENFKPKPTTQLRFLTKHRVKVWNSFCASTLSRHGIPLLDVFPMATAYPEGPFDVMHFENKVFRQAEDDLEDFIIQRLSSIER